MHVMLPAPAGEADTLHSLINLSHSISNDASAEYAHKRRQEMEGAIKSADAEVSLGSTVQRGNSSLPCCSRPGLILLHGWEMLCNVPCVDMSM